MTTEDDSMEQDFWLYNQHLERNKREILEYVPDCLHAFLEEIHINDRGTYAHSIEAGATMLAVLRQLQLTDPDITEQEIRIAVAGATLHDLGKILDGEIVTYINLARDLTPRERAKVDMHARLGYDCLIALANSEEIDDDNSQFVSAVADFALYHHTPGACLNDLTRPYVELLTLIDRGLGLTDINRAYQRVKDRILTPDEAVPLVVTDLSRIDDDLVIDLTSVADPSAQSIARVRESRSTLDTIAQ